MGGVNAAKENQIMISKQIRILENRLEKVGPPSPVSRCHSRSLSRLVYSLRSPL